MKIVWDEAKRLQNLTKHGLDFGALTIDYFETANVCRAKDGRFMAVGVHDRRVVSVVFRPLGSEAISLISMRRASRKERS